MAQNSNSAPSEKKTTWKSISAFFNAIFKPFVQLATRFKNWITRTKPKVVLQTNTTATPASSPSSTADTILSPAAPVQKAPAKVEEVFERIEIVKPSIKFDEASIKTYVENLDKNRKALDRAWHEDPDRTKFLEKIYPSIKPVLNDAKVLVEKAFEKNVEGKQYNLTETEVKELIRLDEDFAEKISVVESARKSLEAEAASKKLTP